MVMELGFKQGQDRFEDIDIDTLYQILFSPATTARPTLLLRAHRAAPSAYAD